MKPDWFPDWSGASVAIIASGPSAKSAGVDRLRGRIPAIAVKNNIELLPSAEVVYGCEAPWWRLQRGLPNYKGLKISYAGALTASFPDIKIIDIEKHTDRFLFDRPGVVGSGGNSGFQAVNLALQFGAKRILLIGFDMHDRSGIHWYGKNRGQGTRNPVEDNFRRWRAAFHNSAKDLVGRGVQVVNSSPHSALKCFPFLTVEQTLFAWGV